MLVLYQYHAMAVGWQCQVRLHAHVTSTTVRRAGSPVLFRQRVRVCRMSDDQKDIFHWALHVRGSEFIENSLQVDVWLLR